MVHVNVNTANMMTILNRRIHKLIRDAEESPNMDEKLYEAMDLNVELQKMQ